MSKDGRRPTLEDVLELSGLDLLHPGGFAITEKIGKIVEMRGKRILDVACERGNLPCYYARNFEARVVGIDLSPDMVRLSVERARREGIAGLTEFRVADSLALPFEDDSFDVVVNECAVGLTSDPQRCLREMARVTRPGGYAVIHESVWLKEPPEREKADVAGRLGTVPYALAEWKEMMGKAGLIDIWTEDWSGPENVYRIRPDRKVTSLNGILSPWEKALILNEVERRPAVPACCYSGLARMSSSVFFSSPMKLLSSWRLPSQSRSMWL